MNRFKLNQWLNRLSVRNLMTMVVAGMGLVFVVQMLLPSVNLYGALALSRAALMRGEIWRLVTFIFLPPNSTFVWILFSLYFYWMIG